MKTRKLGSTQLEVTPVGLGLAALCRTRYLTLHHADDVGESVDREQVFEVLDAAWKNGIRYFDTGRAQGDGEQLLADWLDERNIPPSDVTVASKWGYVRASEFGIDHGRYLRDHSPSNLDKQWAESQSILGPHLQVYQIRSATFASAVLENRAVQKRLAAIKDEGVHVGLTVRGPRQGELIERALEIDYEGERIFESVQATWNLMERSAAPALHEAHKAGLGVIVKEALANGRLTPRNDDPRYANEIDTLRRQAERLETTIDALALAAALDQPWADTVLTGAALPEHLDSNARAVEVQLDQQARQRLVSLERPPEVYWDERETLWA
jgi:aryl-alcohol dehydrogenase-like predicted oxidoreductase